MSGGVWVTADVIMASRTNQKTLLVDTGTNVASISANGGPWTGQLAYATVSSSGINEGSLLNRNNYNTAWGIVTHEIGRSVLTSPAATITVTSIPPADTLVILSTITGTNTGNDNLHLQFNNDSASNYAYTVVFYNPSVWSEQANSGSDTKIIIDGRVASTSNVSPRVHTIVVTNLLGIHKVLNVDATVSLRSASTIGAPDRAVSNGIWDSGAQINRVDITTASGLVTMNSGSRIVVLRGA